MPVVSINESAISGLNKLKSFHALRQREVFCPVSKITVNTTPLTVGDDLSMRTMVASPELYDQEIASLIYNHINFPNLDKKPSFNDFIDSMSSFDKRVILYGIYSTTYDKIGEETVKCPNCGHSFKDKILSSEIIHDDSYSVWDKELPFTEYSLEVPIDINPGQNNTINQLVFTTQIPSIRDHFNVLRLIDPEQMKINYERTNSILSKPEELTLITKSIRIHSTVNEQEVIDNINDFDNIRLAIASYISADITNKIIEEYNKEFDSYSPKFEKRYNCDKCHFDHAVPIQLELSLFRTFFGF